MTTSAADEQRFYCLSEALGEDEDGHPVYALDAGDADGFARILSGTESNFDVQEMLGSLAELGTRVLLLAKVRNDQHRELLEGSGWLEVVLGPSDEDGPRVDSYGSLTDADPVVASLRSLNEAPRSAVANLEKLACVLFEMECDQKQIRRALRDAVGGIPITHVGVYDVGQGNCNGICSSQGLPHMYFDLGGGVLQNKKTWPSGTSMCFTANPVIMLSHWDWDHWGASQHLGGDPSLNGLSQKWIVPAQRVGYQHLKMIADLHARGNLLVWPTGLDSVRAGQLVFFRGNSDPFKDRNGSGIAAKVLANAHSPLNGRGVLLTGDAGYQSLPATSLQGLSGLVVPHHGGACKGTVPEPIDHTARAVISSGQHNSFKHPLAKTEGALGTANWLNLDRTDGRHSASGRRGVLIHVHSTVEEIEIAPPCGNPKCITSIACRSSRY